MRILTVLLIPVFLLSACGPTTLSANPSLGQPSSTFTPIPTLTPSPTAVTTPPPPLGTIALDFVALMCNAQWMNGVQYLSCPPTQASRPGGYPSMMDPASQGLPANTSILLTVPAQNGASSIFGRYPSFTVRSGDRFRTTLRCVTAAPCNVEFALEYFDSLGKYHSNFASWHYIGGDPPIPVDFDLSSLAGQNVNFTLAVRPQDSSPQNDLALWVAPLIFRPMP